MSSPLLQPWAGIYTTGSPHIFGFGLNYTAGFPGTLACKHGITGLLRLYNQVSQFLIINLLYFFSVFPENQNKMYIHIFDSLENQLIQGHIVFNELSPTILSGFSVTTLAS